MQLHCSPGSEQTTLNLAKYMATLHHKMSILSEAPQLRYENTVFYKLIFLWYAQHFLIGIEWLIYKR